MSNANEAKPRITRPRRSILGLRSKLFSANSNKEETGPLYSSSPVEKDKYEAYNTGTSGLSALKKSCSSPSLVHPFEANDANASLFFTKGHSESEWSVFKPTKKMERISNSKARPSVSRKLIDDTALRIEEENTPKYCESNNWGRTKTLDGYRSNRIKKSDGSSKLSVEQKIGLEWLAYEFRSNSKNLGENCDDLKDTLKEPFLREEIEELTEEDKPKYCESNNWTRTKTLDGYHSNGIKKSVCDENNLLISKENHRGDDESSELVNILNQIKNLKECKEEMDVTLTTLLLQKEEFDKKWKLVTSALSRYTTVDINECHDKNSTIVRKKTRPLFNREECDEHFISSFTSQCKLKSTQQFNELKENFNCIQTPVISNKKQLRKSICYTPNSLSAVIGAQACAIFDDDI